MERRAEGTIASLSHEFESRWDREEAERRFKRHNNYMPIIAREPKGGNFVPAPPGTHAAVCVDVVDLGMLEVSFSGKTSTKHKIRIAWQIDEAMEDNRPFLCQKRYTLSLHQKAQLRKDLESWRGKQFSPEELEGFDVENLIGVHCLLNIIQEISAKDGKTYSNIASIMRLPKGMNPVQARDYVRVCDRMPDNGGAPLEDDSAFAGIGDDDVPF
jgi:hypothetical protein